MSTIASVAALAGVGVGTVSRVLNDSQAVSGSTRMRVLEAIEALDYEPSAAARALSTGRTSTIGVVAPFFTEPSVVERLRGMTRRLANSGYQVTLFDVERPEHGDAALRSLAVKGRVDGLLLVSLPPTGVQLERLRTAGIPVVLVDRRLEGATAVFTDDEAGGRLATEHLLRLGHERIAFVGDTENGPFGFTSSEARRHGYEAALRDAGIDVQREYVRFGPHRRDAARAAARELLALSVPPTAVFAASDHQALGVIEAATMAGVDVPERLSVIGFDDVELARYCGLTTVAQPLEASGMRGADLLLEALAGGEPRSQELRLELQVRTTTALTGGKQHERRGKPSYAYASAEWHDARAQAIRGGEMKGHKVLWVVCLAVAMAFAVAACGDDSSSGGDESSGQTKGAKAIDVASMDDAKGDVTYCAGKDTSGDLKEGIAEFNKANPEMNAKLLEFPESADEQRNQFIQRQNAKSSDCDGFEADVVWTAEFASQKWLLDLTPYVEGRKGEFVPSTLTSVDYEGKLWGVPRVTDAGFLYYRKDKIKQIPETWQEVYKEAQAGNGIAYQGAAYEGLTVNFLELAFAAGGEILSEDGKKSVIDSPENLKALEFMVDGIKSGAAPKAVTTYMEEESKRAFEAGRVDFVRKWPYIYALGNKEGSKIKGKFAVAPYPAFEDAGKAAIIGGHNMVISTYSKNPGGALKLIDYMTSLERMNKNAADFSKAPVLTKSYDDEGAKKAMPFLASSSSRSSRPRAGPSRRSTPRSHRRSTRTSTTALSGSTDPKAALKKAQEDMDKALATF